MTIAAAALPRNKLLRVLPAEDLHRIRSLLQPFPLKPRRILHHARLPIEHVYFVEQGLISVMAHTDEEHAIEAWIIGCEGIAGVPVVLGAETSPHRRMVQGEGLALRMRAMDLRLAMDELPALRAALLRYVNSVLVQVGQSGPAMRSTQSSSVWPDGCSWHIIAWSAMIYPLRTTSCRR